MPAPTTARSNSLCKLVMGYYESVTDKLRRVLERSNPVLFTIVAGLAGFSAYFSMYAFRKPFSAATFALVPGWTLRARLQDRAGDCPGDRLRDGEAHRHQGDL